MHISIILPVSEKEDEKNIIRCLDSLQKQTYRNFEVIIISSFQTGTRIKRLSGKYKFLKVYSGDFSKSSARNFGSKKAKGKYLYHLDSDMALTPGVLEECVLKAKKKIPAVIIPDRGIKHKNLILKCRALEREILNSNRTIAAPLFLEKKVFEDIKGYDESLDPADDWNLNMALKKKKIKTVKIKSPALVKDSTNLKNILVKKYKMGGIYPSFREKYPDSNLSNIKVRRRDYFSNIKKFIKSPLTSITLFLLKTLEFLAFGWGLIHPAKSRSRYLTTFVSSNYDAKRSGNNYQKYKHFSEIKSSHELLDKKDKKLLEIGCGTGRITESLVKWGFEVTPVDNSKAMLTEYRKKKSLPEPLLASAVSLPFPDNFFPCVFSLRVIWHLDLKSIEKMAAEASRVSSKYVIFDITNRRKWPAFYRRLYPNEHFFTQKDVNSLLEKNSLEIERKIPLDTLLPVWLAFFPEKAAAFLFPIIYKADLIASKIIPPGRYLVKFKKIKQR